MKKHFSVINYQVQEISKRLKIQDYEAFALFVLRDLMGLEEGVWRDALDAGGPRDCGVDAFWSDDDYIHILQSKFYSPKNQVKETDIENLYNTLLYLENSSEPLLKGRCKKFILEKGVEYRDLIEEGKEVHLFFITSSTLSQAAKVKLELLRRKNPKIKFELWDIDEIYNQYSINQTPKKPEVMFSLVEGEHFTSKGVSGSNAPYVVASLKGLDLFKAYKEYKGAIFVQNLRYYLGKGGKINKEIRATIESNKERKNFWYYNNGLTIICDDFEIKNKNLIVKNLQIVNGGQTTKSIYETLLSIKEKDAEDLKVIARIIKTTETDGLIDRIRDFNNRQNPTKPRDFIAHDKKQRELQTEFKGLNYFYEIGRGERNEESFLRDIKRKKLIVVDNLTVAQAHYSFMGFPAEAKSSKGALLDPNQSHFGKIFTNGIMAQELLFSYLCYLKAKEEYIEFKTKKKELGEEDQFLVHGTTHIVSIMGLIARDVFNLDLIFQSPEKFSKLTSDQVVEELYDQAQAILADIYADKLYDYKQEKKALVPSKYFKNSSDADRILEKVKFKIKKDKSIRTLSELV